MAQVIELLLRGCPENITSDVENIFNVLTLHNSEQAATHLQSSLATLSEVDPKLIEMLLKKVENGQIEIGAKAKTAQETYSNFRQRLQFEEE